MTPSTATSRPWSASCPCAARSSASDWADQDVHEHRTGTKIYRHPDVGDLEVTYDVFELPGEPGLFITTYTADAGSESADRLTLLSAWAATRSQHP